MMREGKSLSKGEDEREGRAERREERSTTITY